MTMAAGRGRRHLQMQGARTKRLTLGWRKVLNFAHMFSEGERPEGDAVPMFFCC